MPHSFNKIWIHAIWSTKETAIKLFEEKQVRSVWDAEHEKWYISIVDVVTVLTESIDPNAGES